MYAPSRHDAILAFSKSVISSLHLETGPEAFEVTARLIASTAIAYWTQ